MATPLKEGTHISVERKWFGTDYDMPSMEMATDHYNLGFTISGERKTITPTVTYSYHAGDVGVMAPYTYHRTVAASKEPYERILIKYSPEMAQPFIDHVGRQIFDSIFEEKIFHFSEENREKILGMFQDMVEEYEKDMPYKEFILQGMLYRLLITVWEKHLPSKEKVVSKTTLTRPVMDALYYIENNYAANPSLELTAKAAGFSAAYFSKLFHEQLGMTYSEYLNNVKLKAVKILLAGTDKSVMEIAQETGYCHGNYLNEQFKKNEGMTPGQYRKQLKIPNKN